MKISLSVVVATLLAASAALAQDADLVIWGGPIHTADEARPTAGAVAVEDGRIVYVGDAAGARERIGADTEVIDLRGAALFPGFTDGHAHLRGVGEREMTLNLEGAASLAEAMDRLATWAADHPQAPVIWGRGWIETHWPEGRTPHRGDLDTAAPGRAVVLTRADGHALVASSEALARAGIDAATAPGFGGEILKDAAGAPTGVLVDAAMALVAGLRPEADAEATEAAYRAGFEVYARYGWTGVHNMSVPPGDVAILEALAARGQAPLRVYNAIEPEGAAGLFASGAREAADGRIVTRAVKVYADGALGSRGAALFAPYADTPHTTGLMQMTAEQALPLYEAALRHGIQIATHAIGDRGNAEVLDWYAAAFAAVPETERAVAQPRWRIEHAQVLRPQDFARFADIPVIASMQPSHAIGDLHFAPARLGDDRLDGAYAWRSLAEAGVTVVGGSDAPVERGDPLIEFYAAVARRDLAGFQGPDWRAREALDRAAALRLFTLAPAWASFREHELGSIEVGKRADFTVFDRDLMTVPADHIPDGRALMTIIDGQVAFRAADW